jgi:osmotically-inducible protein OsmY|nr:BON domain-containing protein [Comamonas sp. CMM01]
MNCQNEGADTVSKSTQRIVQIIAVSALAFGLAACNKAADEGQTAGQKLDSAIANTEKAADNAAANASAAATNAADAAKDAAKEAGNAMVSAADSASITAAVNAGLIKDSELSAIKINVDTKDGVVTLTGEAPNQAAKDRAGDIAKAVQGVSSVANNLTVKAG